MRKTQHILSALSKMAPSQTPPAQITYYALDLEKRELERTLDQLVASPIGPEMRGKISTHGLWGTYEGGLKFVEAGGQRGSGVVPVAAARARSLSSDGTATHLSSTSSDQGANETPLSTPDMENVETPLHILFLGASLGNFPHAEQVPFLRSLPLRAGQGDTLLLGLDHASDAEKIELAYNDAAGITRRFIFNGLKNAGRELGDESLFAPEKWEYVGRYNVQERKLAILGSIS
jgi:L-histidine Nalpha-methyltransferase / hercynylcysteine S-oxide synthase